MSLLVLINLLLIVAGPFAVVGAITAVAMASAPGLTFRTVMVPRPRPATRPRMAVAW